MMSITFTPPHPIVFICDYDNLDAEIPAYDSATLTSSTATCISVGTIAYVDGDVTIMLDTIVPDNVRDTYVEAFSGEIETPSQKLAIVTSEDERVLEIVIGASLAHVNIFVNDTVHPSKLWVSAQNSLTTRQ